VSILSQRPWARRTASWTISSATARCQVIRYATRRNRFRWPRARRCGPFTFRRDGRRAARPSREPAFPMGAVMVATRKRVHHVPLAYVKNCALPCACTARSPSSRCSGC
jgi:hypothetical protein